MCFKGGEEASVCKQNCGEHYMICTRDEEEERGFLIIEEFTRSIDDEDEKGE